MELGRIKWAGHYNSQTGDYNNNGFIAQIPCVRISEGASSYVRVARLGRSSISESSACSSRARPVFTA
jgi:hypothetical protein